MTAEETKQYKAKQLRYKRPIARNMNLAFIQESVWNMCELIEDVKWFIEDDENLVNSMNGGKDDAYAFKMAFSDLAAELENFENDLNNEYIPDCFDDLFPPLVPITLVDSSDLILMRVTIMGYSLMKMILLKRNQRNESVA